MFFFQYLSKKEQKKVCIDYNHIRFFCHLCIMHFPKDTPNEADLSKIAITHPVDADVTVGYFDSDIITIDNVKLLTDPTTARLQMNVVAFCNQGKMQASMNGQPIVVRANQLLICPSQVSFTDFMFSPDFAFKAIFISNSMLQTLLHDKINLWTTMLYVKKTNVLTLDAEGIRLLNLYYEMQRLIKETTWVRACKTEVAQSILRAALLCLCELFEEQLPNHHVMPMVRNASTATFQKFLNLLHSTTMKHRPVEWYANQLCISSKYLSAICKDNSGRTANQWIQEHVLEDIRYYLKSTDLSIKQICDQLGFPNPSFFGKFVRQHFGMTPIQLRREGL